MIWLLLFAFCNFGYSQDVKVKSNAILDLASTIHKIVIIHPEHGEISAGTAFCTKVAQEGSQWRVTLTTCKHVAKSLEFKYGPAGGNMYTKVLIHRFYPTPQSFIMDRFEAGQIPIGGKDIYRLSYLTKIRPDMMALKKAKKMPKEGEWLVTYGCPKGMWPVMRLHTYLAQNKEGINLMPYSDPGTSGSPIVNMQGRYVGILNKSNPNFTAGLLQLEGMK